MCVFCFTLSMSGSHSRLHLSLLEGRVRGRRFARSPFSLPLTTPGFCQVEPSSFRFPSSSFHSSSLFFSWGSPAFIKYPPPFSVQTQPRYPCQIHWRQPEEVNMEPIDSLLSLRRKYNIAETITGNLTTGKIFVPIFL